MIQVQNLSKSFDGVKAVDGISFSVPEGETLILLGTSGCGKTTTLKMLNRLIEPDAGKILINGENVRAKDPVLLRRGIGFVIQNIGLFPHLSVYENIATVPRLLKWEESKISQRVNELLEMLGMMPEKFRDRLPRELSGGQKQRIGIARALAADPPVILLDEPFGALDPITRDQVREEFMNLEQLQGKTKVMVTHDVGEACDLGDQICLMDKGKIVQMGTPKELIFTPQAPFVEAFFRPHLLQVELKAIKLIDLISFLPKGKAEFDSTRKYLSASSLDAVLKNKDQGIEIISDSNESIRFATRELLIAALYKYKSSQHA